MIILSTTFLMIILGAAVYMIIQNRRAEKIVPHAVGNKTIHLKRKEISHFEKLSRADQRMIINRMQARAKSGKFKTVYQDGKQVGYVRK